MTGPQVFTFGEATPVAPYYAIFQNRDGRVTWYPISPAAEARYLALYPPHHADLQWSYGPPPACVTVAE
jgi:hypothetical protein